MTVRILTGDARALAGSLPRDSINCIVTSPPYYRLRDYGVSGQIGLEGSVSKYIAELVGVFEGLRSALRSDGTLLLNLGDSYNGTGSGRNASANKNNRAAGVKVAKWSREFGLKPKDLIGIPWRVAFALQEAGWYLRQEVIWHKPNPMPSSVQDRCTSAHEHVFLLAHPDSGGRYFFDSKAIQEQAVGRASGNKDRLRNHRGSRNGKVSGVPWDGGEFRNRRDVWSVPTKPFRGAHFATMPEALAELCILAACPEGGTVLDPFGGAGTVGLVADRLNRNAVLVEINPEYADMAERRITGDSPMFARVPRGDV